eukprot:Skav232177  [mRNA]  locus=scaffold1328:13018:19410:- [translate_table: standard]
MLGDRKEIPLSVVELSEVAVGIAESVGLVTSSSFRATSRAVAQRLATRGAGLVEGWILQQTLPGLLSSSKIYVLSAWKGRPEKLSLFTPGRRDGRGTFEKAWTALQSDGTLKISRLVGEPQLTEAVLSLLAAFQPDLAPAASAAGGRSRNGCVASAHRWTLRGPGSCEGRWETVPPLLEPCCDAAAVAKGSVVFLMGGTDRFGEVTNDVESLEVSSKAWRRGPPLLGPRHGGTAANTAESLVLFGGSAVARPGKGVWAVAWLAGWLRLVKVG